MRKKWFVAFTISVIILIITITIFIFRGFIFSSTAEKAVLKAGKPIKFGNYTVFIDKITNNKLFGIKITGNDKKLEAKSGDYVYMPNENAIKFNLIDGVAENVDPINPNLFRRLTFKQMVMKIRLKTFISK